MSKDKEEKALEASEQAPAEKVKLSEKDRTFTVEATIKGKKQKVTAVLADVNKLYISGVKYSPEQFLTDTELQVKAVEMGHILLTIKK